MQTEHFIPLRKSELVERLISSPELNSDERSTLAELLDVMSGELHRQFHQRLESLKELYSAFDPDLATVKLSKQPNQGGPERLTQLFDEFEQLAVRANFRPLTLADLNFALANRSDWGLNLEIDMDAFDRLELYARGDVVGQRQRRRLRNWFRLEQVDVRVYERLIVIFRLSDLRRVRRYANSESVFVKLFKDIPQHDLDMLLPATSVKMTIVDRAKILIPTVSGLGIAVWKILQGALLAAFAGVYGLLTFFGFLGGTIGYGVRSFYGYLNTKNKYQLSLTESLYYQNLDNNAGVFFRLLDEAEEQENCEAMLAYFFLWRHAPESGWTAEELDDQVESLLRSLADRPIDFEVSDALAKLLRFELAEQVGDCYRVVSPEAAIERLKSVKGVESRSRECA
jgi:hypothetical protein